MNFSVTAGSLLLEGIGAMLGLTAFIYILVASIRLVRTDAVPGARLMLGAIVFTLAGALLSGVYPYAIEENALVDAAISLVSGAALFAGSFGFWRLARHVIASTTPGGRE